jgi:hypothetical protein
MAVPAATARRAWVLTAVAAIAYLALAPPSPDLATASYRGWLLSGEGLTLWDNAWYGGHHLPAYSLLSPALGALIGPRLLAAVSVTVAAALFPRIVEGRFNPPAERLAAWWFALGAAIALLSSRVAFDLGLALGLAALLAAQRRRNGAALALTLLTSLASPVAGAFLALALLAWALTRPPSRWPAALTVAALLPILMLAYAFPEGGTQPFVASAFYPALAGVLAVGAFVPREQRALRIGVALYALAMVAAYVLPTAVGGNADRLGALVAGPVAALVLVGGDRGRDREAARRRRWALAVLGPLLLYWQANAPAADFGSAVSDPGVPSAYYRPLVDELHRRGVGFDGRPARVEVVPSVDHWEARWVGAETMIARGWERQLDRYRDGLFYSGGPLTAARYHDWLRAQSISLVALPDAPLDYSAKAEARLLRAGPPAYLHEVWRSPHWRLFAVADAVPLVQPPATLTALGHSSFAIRAPAPGSYTVRVHFTPYWALAGGGGCVARAPGDWTEVRARRAGELRVVIRFSLDRVFDHGARCG